MCQQVSALRESKRGWSLCSAQPSVLSRRKVLSILTILLRVTEMRILFLLVFVLSLSISQAAAQVHNQPFEQGDLLPFIDVGNQKTSSLGNWRQEKDFLEIRRREHEAFNRCYLTLPFAPDGSPFVLEFDVERLSPGSLIIGIPFQNGKQKVNVECGFDHEDKFSGPMIVNGLVPRRQVYELKKSPTREFKKPLLPSGKKVSVICDVSAERIVGKVGTTKAFDFQVDLNGMVPTDFDLTPRPHGELCLQGTGDFRFTRLFAKGKGTVSSVSAPGSLTKVAPEPEPALEMLPPPAPLPAPIADLATGQWAIKPLSNEHHLEYAKLYVVSCQKGDVRGALQWQDSEGAWACEIVRGQIAGSKLTLNGLDLTAERFLFALGRYTGDVTPDGKSFQNVQTMFDGRPIQQASEVERWEANWIGPDIAWRPETKLAFNDTFLSVSEQDLLFRQFTEYKFMTEHKKSLHLRAHRVDRHCLPELARSSNPRIGIAALALMHSENLRDSTNRLANSPGAMKQIEKDVADFRQAVQAANATAARKRDLATTIANPLHQAEAQVAAESERVARTFAAFGAMLDAPGAQDFQLRQIDRMRNSLLGWDCKQIISQQMTALLKERPAPVQPSPRSWSTRLNPGSATITLTVTNTGKTTLHNCIFITDFTIDQKKIEAKWEKQQQMTPLVNGFLSLTLQMPAGALERGEVDTQLTYELLAHDRTCCVRLPEWQPGQQLTIPISTTMAASFGRKANLVIWSDETGFQETGIGMSLFAGALKKSLK